MAASGVLAVTGCVTASGPVRGSFFKATGKPIGLQLYTLGDDVAKDLAGIMEQVAAIGFRDIELPQLYGRTPAELRKAADAAGLSLSSIHLAAMPGMGAPDALSLLSDTQRIVEDLGILGITSAVMPIAPFPARPAPREGETFMAAIGRLFAAAGADHWKRTADTLNQKAAALAPHGITVGYHNHNMEFAPVGDTTGWDILVSLTDPALVKFEIDTGWVSASGMDPAAFFARHAGRVKWMHVKDVLSSTQTNFALSMDPTEVGSGKLDWSAILPAARAAGVEHFYLEQEPPFAIPRIDAARQGYDYLAGLIPAGPS